MNRFSRRAKTLPAHLALVGICMILMAPLYWMVITAVKPLQEALAKSTLMSFDFQNRMFTKAFLVMVQYGLFWRHFLMTPKNPDEFCDLLGARGIVVK